MERDRRLEELLLKRRKLLTFGAKLGVTTAMVGVGDGMRQTIRLDNEGPEKSDEIFAETVMDAVGLIFGVIAAITFFSDIKKAGEDIGRIRQARADGLPRAITQDFALDQNNKLIYKDPNNPIL